jgi:YD repeat-containing protein
MRENSGGSPRRTGFIPFRLSVYRGDGPLSGSSEVYYETLEVRAMLVSDVADWLSVSSGGAPEGGVIIVTVAWGGTDPQASLDIGLTPASMTYPGIDYNSNFSFSGTVAGSGSKTFSIQILDDQGFPNETDGGEAVIVGANLYEPDGGPKSAQGEEVITDSNTPTNCTCSCSCGNVEPKVANPTGRPLANSGQGPLPQDLGFDGDQRPHPIATVNDTLSSTVGQASDIKVQSVLTDLSGSVLYTGSPVYYSPAGYTAGQQVQFSQQLDATGLADGTYGYTTTVTEEYPNGGAPILRTYSDFVPVHNLDASAYGSGWLLRNVDRLVPQAGGASLEAGGGNVYYFPLDYAAQYDPPVNRPDIASLVKNGDGTFTLSYRDASQEIFSSAGLLTAAVDKNANRISYVWNADNTLSLVTDQAGRQTQFAYAAGKLTSVTDFAGRVTSYGFTGSQLTTITLPDPGHGETQHATTMGYDGTTGMLDTITDAGGTTSLEYNSFREVTRISEPDGTSTQYAAPDSQSLVDTSNGVGTQANPAPLVYTANVTGSVTDGNGHTSHDTTGQYGEITSTTDATGANATDEQYNDQGLVTQISEPPLTAGGSRLITAMDYDPNGNLIERDSPDGTRETWTIDPTWNEPTVYVDPAGRETDYALTRPTATCSPSRRSARAATPIW